MSEYLLRYSLFRAYVLSIQEELGSVFQRYGLIYQDLFRKSTAEPQFNFWRVALKKWYIKMRQLMPSFDSTYCHFITKMRMSQLEQAISSGQIELNENQM